MKGILVIIALLTISTTSFSQTKRIAHRSHSGANSTFAVNSIHNFGETPEMKARWRAKLDSINKPKPDTLRKPATDTLKKPAATTTKKWKAKKTSKPVAKTTR